MDTLILEPRAIAWSYDGAWLRIEAHGRDGLRLRASVHAERPACAGALLDVVTPDPVVSRDGAIARIENGTIVAEVDLQGRVRFLDSGGRLLLEEKWRQRDTVTKFWTVGTEDVRTISALGIAGREFKPLSGDVSQITVRFEAKPGERLFGMGQYQQANLDLAGCLL